MLKAFEISEVAGGRVIGNGNAAGERISTDTRDISEGDIFIALCGERFDGNDFVPQAFEKGAQICVVSRECSVPDGRAAVVTDNTGTAFLEIAAHYRNRFNIKLIGITGSVGKTTTKEMTACAVGAELKTLKTEGNFNNEIGMPKTLLRLDETYEAAVIEMGMSHLGEISRMSRAAKPDIAIITNIGVSHIENLGSRENILKAKMEITDGMKDGSTLILNGEDELLRNVTSDRFKIISYGLGIGYDISGEVLTGNSVRVLGEKITLSVEGRHNLLNACAAMAAASALGISPAKAARGIEAYRPDGKRQTIVNSPRGFSVMCDYYNASPQSVGAALGILSKKEGRKIAVLGDMLELGAYSAQSHRDMGRMAADLGIDHLFTYGNESIQTSEGAADAGLRETIHFSDKQKLAAFLKKFLQKGDFVLIKGSRGMKMEDIFEIIMG